MKERGEFVATARDKLIADWHDRLALAQSAEAASPGRPAWMARLQVRLYRFLLSLYGDAEWTTTTPRRAVPNSGADKPPGAVVFDSSAALPLAGKPPKSLGQIQSVLKSVANAQTQAPAAGPLTQGLPPESWVTLALSPTKHRPRINRVVEALTARGIESRVQHHPGRYVLEVRASELQQAMRIAREQPPRPIRKRVASRLPKPGPLAPYLAHVMVIATVVGIFSGQIAMDLSHGVLQGLDRSLIYYELPHWVAFFAGWLLGAFSIATAAVTLDLLVVTARNLRLPRRMSVAEFSAGLAWHCLATGFFVGPLVGLLAVWIARLFGLQDDATIFSLAWTLTVLSAGVIHISRAD